MAPHSDDPGRKRQRLILKAGSHRLVLGDRTRLVGVVNITPDSFYDGGRYLDPASAVEQALALVEQGADMLDLGAESSRPGAAPVSADDELKRLLPVLESVRVQVDVPLMVDTYKSSVARRALEAGADLINDISAFKLDPEMASTVAESEAGLVLMHMRGTPPNMQKIPPSREILAEIRGYFEGVLALAAECGIPRDRIILDPGIGFGKTVADNLAILNRLSFLKFFQLPILVGTSRKTFIGRILDKPVERRLWGTAATVAAAVMRGAHFVRVHDVEEMRQVVQVADSIVAERRVE